MTRAPWSRMALAAASGAVGAFGLAPHGLWGLTVLSLLILPTILLKASGWRQAAWIGWAFGAGWFAHGLIWIVEPFLVDPVRHGWMAPFALLLLPGGLALFWAAAFGAAWALAAGTRGRIALLILFWALAEFARAYVLTGFPWANLAQAWIIPQLLSLVGPHGAGLVILLLTLPAGAAFQARRSGAAGLGLMVLAAVAVVSTFGVGRVTYPTHDTATVRVIQPNAPQHQKWDPAYMPVFFQRQLDFTAAGPRPDLIVWPESAVPVLLHQADDAFAQIAQAAGGVPVILGIQRYDGTRVFNSLVVLDAEGRLAGIYDKHHLVPFGEYMPLGRLAARLNIFGLAANTGMGYSPGPGPDLLDLGALGTALPLICYEAVFPQNVTGAPGRPDMLLQVTNDAWFGTHSGPYQHLAQARMRAIELGVPMIRAANTGISAVIDPGGAVLGSIPLGEAGFVDVPLPLPVAPTVYARTGDGPVFVLLLVCIVAGLFGRSRMNSLKSH